MSDEATLRLMEQHVRSNPDLVRARESDLRELSGYGEAAAARELERRRSGPRETYDLQLTAEELVDVQELIGEREDLPWTEGVNRKLGRLIRFAQRDIATFGRARADQEED